MSTLDVRSRRASRQQLELLCDYLSSHQDLAVAYNRSLQAKEYSKEKWKELAEILNSQGDGCHKDWRGWSKYWVDLKAKLKGKVASLARSGGGPPSEPLLSDLDKRFLQVLGEDFGHELQGVQVEQFAEECSPQPTPVAGPERTPRRRRRWREPAMSEEAARRALVKSSQQRADAATKSASSLERIAQGIENGLRVLQSIDRAMNAAAFPRAAE